MLACVLGGAQQACPVGWQQHALVCSSAVVAKAGMLSWPWPSQANMPA